MLRIACPYCSERDENEFVFGGQADIEQSGPADTLSDQDWADYLFYRDNPKGLHFERWQHRFGCRQWFSIVRHTLTHEILGIYRAGEAKPVLDKEESV